MSAAVENAKRKLRQFPVAFAQCTEYSAAYALCISATEHPKKDQCRAEFDVLKKCFDKALTAALARGRIVIVMTWNPALVLLRLTKNR
ncbi:hypothetical protein BV898_13259 [Hypsibius exemplaris]|uniref:IMS import disulfide relay-system CHCH-CHCH-like Cx9C domain-containing protein n=1 Tax=Hypsibius exemplaris TaxID=2072580 RepID=A0A1W0WB73_HYPEX|nr:hypothetical protein BV898_13259 [Hypsibius exemplaris]